MSILFTAPLRRPLPAELTAFPDWGGESAQFLEEKDDSAFTS
jgi:hypothetical protein